MIPQAVTFAAIGRPECPQLNILRIDGSIWFGAVDQVTGRLGDRGAKLPGQKYLLLLVGGVKLVDVACAEAPAREAESRGRDGGALQLAGLKPGVFQPLTRGDHFREIAAENAYED